MNPIEDLMTLSRAYLAATNVGLTTLSSRMFNDGKKLSAIEAGGDIQVGRYKRAIQWLSDNWPANAQWPMDIPRPAASIARAEAPAQ